MPSRAGSLCVMVLTGAVMAACSTAPVRSQASRPAPPPVASHVAAAPTRVSITLPPSSLTDDQRIIHVLNRLGYGPRPGDVERVKQMGLAAYMDRQLDPGRLPDERAEAAVQVFPAVALSITEVLRSYPEPDPKLLAKVQSGEMSQQELRQMAPLEKRPARVAAELQAVKLTRAVLSERQLQEVMVDFWFNHFNVDARKGAVKWMVADYERAAIRPHALGKFRDLLLATARHPAMLFYLDNWMSTRADLVVRAGPQRGRQMGLNENYAREIMELHTLGVDGGYTQQDVIDVARGFTGWSIEKPREQGTFVFRAAAHDQGEKHILGHVLLPGGGEADGVRVIDILSRHPSTAKFIATKLVRHFVSDTPPPALVDRVANAFTKSDGDIRETLKAIFFSNEFNSPEAYRAKIKRPFELVVSAIRTLGADTNGGPGTHQWIARMGEPLYGFQTPNGYSDAAENWVNTGALLERMNFGLALASNRIPGTQVNLAKLTAQDKSKLIDESLRLVVAGDISASTRETLMKQIDEANASDTAAKVVGLILGTPEFQRQ